mmetsp:Transcript_4934/g.5781  ORF Transcript_4934/g.5781 Transcript_4934/m.5781 type:complete len:117 (+) Transcript_4934:174-524(+)|eukprot:CAMPEP_0197849342 /NCGR_PEP_ID=MMETSP1438-20131217/11686_1 /TAXON_ID=1461541 /ORGANISM="Pterosperma sp., Strain CCMP1384" /LENGTH=116 /DNA_ID=CAMNT_0043461975 /DNA_START=172 /DNA_END=522 /DNA_ORIENTATION=+
MADSDQWLPQLLDKLTEDKFLQFLDDFTYKHCDDFHDGEEQSLEHTEIHQQYKRMFESRIEAYLKNQNCTIDTFMSVCKERLASDESYRTFFDALLQVEDYEAFRKMMVAKQNDGD